MLYNLKYIRTNKRLTLKRLSIKTGISKTYLNDLENLKCYNISYKKMQRLTQALDTTIEKLEGDIYGK